MGQGGLDSNPEGLIHDDVRHLKASRYSIIQSLHVRLSRQITGKKKARSNLSVIKELSQRDPRYRRISLEGQGKTKPGGI